ncbi:MAG: hypothetical protein L7V86_07115 [Verrucomicrobiales bacterium]|nr:hypothetical protein [Verrucomicrobiales bacterium]
MLIGKTNRSEIAGKAVANRASHHPRNHIGDEQSERAVMIEHLGGELGGDRFVQALRIAAAFEPSHLVNLTNMTVLYRFSRSDDGGESAKTALVGVLYVCAVPPRNIDAVGEDGVACNGSLASSDLR